MHEGGGHGAPPQAADPYQPPRSTLVERETTASAEELIAFMTGYQPGIPASKYYEKQVDHWEQGESPSFHFPALLGAAWCFWRKLYLVGFVVYFFEFALGIVAYLVAAFAFGVDDSAILPVAPFVVLLLTRVPLAWKANRLYIWRATRAARKVADRGLRGDDADLALRALGGTSGLGLALAILINMAFRLISG